MRYARRLWLSNKSGDARSGEKEKDMELKQSVQLGGVEFSIETGKIAKQADGAVIVRYGDTMVLVAAVGTKPREGIDFFPLTVEYRE